MDQTFLFENPNCDIHRFEGLILLNKLGRVKLSIENFVYRGSVLKCTDYAFGVVTYVGKKTKIMMNGNEFKVKNQKFR